MIIDILENAPSYGSLNSRFEKAFSFLVQPGIADLPEGRHDIDDDFMHAVVARGKGRRKDEALLEAHDRFIDIQFVVSGIETMGWLSRQSCTHPSAEYDSEADLQFYLDKPLTWFTVEPGHFAVFFPGDGHLPMISAGEIHKVIIKVPVD